QRQPVGEHLHGRPLLESGEVLRIAAAVLRHDGAGLRITAALLRPHRRAPTHRQRQNNSNHSTHPHHRTLPRQTHSRVSTILDRQIDWTVRLHYGQQLGFPIPNARFTPRHTLRSQPPASRSTVSASAWIVPTTAASICCRVHALRAALIPPRAHWAAACAHAPVSTA